MPRPRRGESKKDYISRAIPAFIHEGFKIKEAQGRAFGFWETYSGKGKKKKRKKKDEDSNGDMD